MLAHASASRVQASTAALVGGRGGSDGPRRAHEAALTGTVVRAGSSGDSVKRRRRDTAAGWRARGAGVLAADGEGASSLPQWHGYDWRGRRRGGWRARDAIELPGDRVGEGGPCSSPNSSSPWTRGGLACRAGAAALTRPGAAWADDEDARASFHGGACELPHATGRVVPPPSDASVLAGASSLVRGRQVRGKGHSAAKKPPVSSQW
jgi:hypothetical protein